jgi:hypothetical protein
MGERGSRMTETLRRPSLFVPLSVRFLTGATGTKLLEKFGRDGPLVWAAFLAACKENRPQGELTWASEPEVWNRLGLSGYEPDFTFDEFIAYTGRLKLTRRRDVRKTRAGRVQHVRITVWERWTQSAQRENERERKARKRAESTADIPRTPGGTSPGQKPDLESESEKEKENFREVRSTTTPPQHTNGYTLDFQTEAELTRLLGWIGNDADNRTAAVLRHNWTQAPEPVRRHILNTLENAKPRDRARWLIGTIKAETQKAAA